MYYELYIDSLFLVNFVMNLYLLLLVNHFSKCSATRLRMITAAAAGALGYCIAIIIPGVPAMIKLVAGTGIVCVGMIRIAFRPSALKAFARLTENLIGTSFLFGGVFLFLLNRGGGIGTGMVSLAGIMGTGGIIFLFAGYLIERRRKCRSDFCKVTLIDGESCITVQALIDSGNGLSEPISGKPVSIVDKSVMQEIWTVSEPRGFRVIPYHSVGCPRGIMEGYLIPEAVIELEGIRHKLKDIYVGVSGEDIASDASYRMILNPKLLEGEKAYDIKSGNTGRFTIQDDSEGTGISTVEARGYPLYRRCGGSAAAVRSGKGK